MSGEARLLADPGGRLVGLVRVLERLHTTGSDAVVVGGLAVLGRVAVAYRVTDDIDHVVGPDSELLTLLDAQGSRRESAWTIDGVKVDVIEVGATPAALCAMKLQSAPRRPEARRYKTGSDYADLYRLLDSAADLDATVGALRTAPAGLGAWALDELHHRFDDEAERTVRAIRSATNLPLSEGRSRSCSSSCRCRAHRQLGTARPWFRPVNPKELEMIIRTNALDMLGVD